MGEWCSICKMVVTSLKIHWKINHKNREFTTGHVNLGFRATGFTPKQAKLKRCSKCKAKVKDLDQHNLLQHPIVPQSHSGTSPQTPAAAATDPLEERLKGDLQKGPTIPDCRIKRTTKFLEELAKKGGTETISEFVRFPEKPSDIESMKGFIFSLRHKRFTTRILTCCYCSENLCSLVINSKEDQQRTWNTLRTHLTFFCKLSNLLNRQRPVQADRRMMNETRKVPLKTSTIDRAPCSPNSTILAKIDAEPNVSTAIDTIKKEEKDEGPLVTIHNSALVKIETPDVESSPQPESQLLKEEVEESPAVTDIVVVSDKEHVGPEPSAGPDGERYIYKKVHKGRRIMVACPWCSLILRNKASFRRHKKIHHEKGKHECVGCGKKFVSKTKWLAHMKMHNSQTACGECGILLPSKSRLDAHMKSRHMCLVCGKVFKKPQNTDYHRRSSKCCSISASSPAVSINEVEA